MTKKRPEDARWRGWSGTAARGFDLVLNVGAALAAVLLCTIMLATVVKVFFRYGLNESLVGIDQLSGTAMLYITFLGAAWVLRREEHVTIDLLLGALRPQAKVRMIAISSIIGALICLTVALFGTLEVASSWQRGVLIPNELEYMRAFNLVVIPVGFLCLGLQFLRRARNYLRGELPPPEAPVRPV